MSSHQCATMLIPSLSPRLSPRPRNPPAECTTTKQVVVIAQQHLSPTRLNNLAIHELNGGNFKAADKLLGMALSRTFGADRDTQKEGKASKISFQTSCSWANDVIVPRRPQECESFGTFIYSRGMLVSEKVIRAGKSQVSTVAKAILFYNSALVAHLLGMETHDSSKLRKAHSLYRIAGRLLVLSQQAGRPASGAQSSSIRDAAPFFHMAILNNLGQLSYELAEFALCKNCFGQLQKHLKDVLARAEDPQAYTRSEIRGMIANSVIQPPTTAPCA